MCTLQCTGKVQSTYVYMNFCSCHLGLVYILITGDSFRLKKVYKLMFIWSSTPVIRDSIIFWYLMIGFNKFYELMYIWSSTPVIWDSFIFWYLLIGFNKFYELMYIWNSTPVIWNSFIFWCLVAQKKDTPAFFGLFETPPPRNFLNFLKKAKSA